MTRQPVPVTSFNPFNIFHLCIYEQHLVGTGTNSTHLASWPRRGLVCLTLSTKGPRVTSVHEWGAWVCPCLLRLPCTPAGRHADVSRRRLCRFENPLEVSWETVLDVAADHLRNLCASRAAQRRQYKKAWHMERHIVSRSSYFCGCRSRAEVHGWVQATDGRERVISGLGRGEKKPHIIRVIVLDKLGEFRCQGTPGLDHHEDLCIAFNLALPQVGALDSCTQDCAEGVGGGPNSVIEKLPDTACRRPQRCLAQRCVPTWDDIDASRQLLFDDGVCKLVCCLRKGGGG